MPTSSWITTLSLSHFSLVVLGKSLWSTQPASFENIIKTAYPIGNGQLAALPFGEPGSEKLSLNRDSLWNGGPFEDASYNGGNPNSSVASALPGIRDWIFQNGTGNVTALMGSNDNYGSYQVLGNLSVLLQDISGATGYKRMLDLDTGIHTTTFKTANASFTTTVYCSYPDSVCVYEVNSTATLPRIDIYFENVLSDSSLVKASCSTSTKSAQFSGITRTDIGMIYKAEARVFGSAKAAFCSNTTGTLIITPSNNQRSLGVVISAGTNYDATKGTAADNYSFKGEDPGIYVSNTVAEATSKSSQTLRDMHISDFSALVKSFTLNLSDPLGSANKETATVIAAYNTTDNSHTDPWVESLLFDFSRYLFISSSRDNSLPPNLQGKWAYGLYNAWGADYHANINMQMNHWVAVQTGLGDLQSALWTYMSETWAPRGAETAKLLYDAPGWVVHDEINIFGHTGMKSGDEYWADYPAAAAWMMQHVFDYYDYSRDETWLRETGYPFLKSISEFWLSQLQRDEYSTDGSFVVNPCSSPEHGPTTFACTHYQQLIHALFTSSLQAARILCIDRALQTSLETTLASLDNGLRISPSNQLQEWKIDLPALENSTHRHLSHLVGWFPGSSLASYLDGYSNPAIGAAVRNSLLSRGAGIQDANAGWEKVWRAACWARLNETETAYRELRLAVAENVAGNALSMYSGKNEPFQIDANFGYGGAVLGMLVVDLPEGLGDEGQELRARAVVLGPAIPKEWGGGRVEGLRVRGGGVVNFEWDGEGIAVSAVWMTKGVGNVKMVNVRGEVLA